MGGFDSFVMFAEMRTGSNFLESNLNALDGVTCLGELFNPKGKRTNQRPSKKLFVLMSVFCGLTPELSRTAARHGVMVHVII